MNDKEKREDKPCQELMAQYQKAMELYNKIRDNAISENRRNVINPNTRHAD